MMDSFEFNKIAGAVLGTLLFLMGLGIVTDSIFHVPAPKVAGYDLPAVEAEHAGGPAAAAPAAVPVADLLAKADPTKGAAVAKAQCSVCHNFEKGAPVKQGPTLFGVVDRHIGSMPGFSYSPAIQERSKTDQTWTFDHLNTFVSNPRGYANGTKMTFGGLKSDTQRGDLLAYLRTLSDNPVPLPTSAPAPAPAPAK
jgi:cytochrome c